MARLPNPNRPMRLVDFIRAFSSEEACAAYLERTRWPNGFVCRFCGVAGEATRFVAKPHQLRCRNCYRDTSLTAGTVMHRTKLPLSTWFIAAHLMTSAPSGVSARQIQQKLDLNSGATAFMLLHKLRAAMVRPFRDRIGGPGVRVEVDETFVGGKTRGEGRGRHHKAPVVAAVEVLNRIDEKGKPHTHAGRARMRQLPEVTSEGLIGFIRESVEPGSVIVTDGLQKYRKITEYGYTHDAVILDGSSELADAHLPMVHLIFSLLKRWLNGTHQGAVSRKHLQAYVNEYIFRFNRRRAPFAAFDAVLGIGVEMDRGPEYREIFSGSWRHPNPAVSA